MIDVVETREALDRAIAADEEAAHLRGLLHALRGEIEEARTRLETVRRRHALEEADVQRLDGITVSALMAAVRGTRTGELTRERAEEVAARFAVQSALERLRAVEARREEVDRRLAQLGDTRVRREERTQEHAEALRSAGPGASSPGLERVLDELAAVRTERREVDEALDAGRRAATQLDAAARHLGSADSWSAYDTWFGGGLVASAVKHDRLDSAAARVTDAQEALADFARELADVGPASRLRTDLGISPTTRTFDVWFDNIFSDLSVRSRIKESSADVAATAASVAAALDGLRTRQVELMTREAALVDERDGLVSRRG